MSAKDAERFVGKIVSEGMCGEPCIIHSHQFWKDLAIKGSELSMELERHEKFTRWLIGELIKGELDEEAVMDKLVEFGFAECKDGYISVRVEI